ncbi:FAD-dependent oxidoreductase [Aquimarina sp. ERC-38]|uniref:NAD(P)/FAD-dependent oxidoreductase n=1 Tax=Aquimarina sp. ERC-38 TaxID=2949996 RepID=UPI002246415F|nr:NAD(P)/FAD-dependent oxidoreductase [Aquimarina sp. ERC-38]UZO79827.1 FAD-dependent oxidoreductase [Aquimarina sp. ERC-38]
MNKSDYKIHIVGAGISGLIAAQVLENYGYHPVIVEASDRVGGRVRSETVNGYVLDVGFQVLLDAYPAAKKYLDYKKLNLQKLTPGALLFSENHTEKIGDPLREPSLFFSTVLAKSATFSDKFKILKLALHLKKTRVEDIFNHKETTTLQYLRNLAFSEQIITQFFTPFFAGIYLEDQLATSSRMFEFVFKMFTEGSATIPKDGIEAIPIQLKSNLKNTQFLFQTKVKRIEEGLLILKDKSEMKSHFTIVATDPGTLITNLKNQKISWNYCDTLYFTTNQRRIQKPIIGLKGYKEGLVNNIFYPTSIPNKSKGTKEVVSVTIVKKHDLSEEELIQKVIDELNTYYNLDQVSFLKRFIIKNALPVLSSQQYELDPTETRLNNTIFLAGDYLLNPSLNAAMISGERAALGIIKSLEDGLVVEEFTSEFT